MRPSLNHSSSSDLGTGPNWLPSVVCMCQFSAFLTPGEAAGACGASTGTDITAWHLGHFVFFPAAESGALSLALQPGQTTCKGMGWVPTKVGRLPARPERLNGAGFLS